MQEEGASTPQQQSEEVEDVYARVARLEAENKKKEEKIQKLLENRKKMRDSNSQLKGYQKSYQRQLDESHEEAIFNIKMLQEHFHKENKKMEGGKQKEIENIEQTLKRKENEAEIWKAQAIKMEKQLDDLMARVKIVAGFIAVIFIAWMCYIFLVAPALGAPDPSASVLTSSVTSTKLTALMSIHWPDNLKAAENLSLAFSSGNFDRLTMVLLSAPPTQQPLLLSLLTGALTDEFLYPLPEISSLKKTQRLGNHTLFLSPLTTEDLIDDIYTHLTTTTLTTIPLGERASAVFFIYAKDAVSHLTAFSRWADHPFYLEDFEADGTKRGASLKNTCFFVIADDSATKLVTSFTSSRKGKIPVPLDRVTLS